MTAMLAEKTCTPCRGGVPPLSPAEAEAFQAQAPAWTLRDEATRIDRTYRFTNFAEAAAFVRRAAELAEAEGTTRTSRSAGNTRPFRCGRRRSRACTRVTSSWPPSSTALSQMRPLNAGA